MSAIGIDTGLDERARGGPDEISQRLEALPASSHVWRLVILLSLGGCFEIYDLFFTGYIAPGLTRSGLLTTTTQAFFGFSGIGAFVAATFAGLFVGAFFLGFLADRFGRRSIFTFALLGYSAASVAMACQTSAEGLLLWRFIAGIGIGVEIITIDAYITELVPSWMRGRAFAVNQAVMFIAVPIVALLSWWLVPLSPYGVEGWRWVVLIGAAGSMVIWVLRLYVPESPLWLARHGRTGEADKILASLESAAGDAPAIQKKPAATKQAPATKPRFSRICSSRPICRWSCCSWCSISARRSASMALPIGCRRCWSKRASPSPRACNIPSSSPLPIRSRRCWRRVSPTGSSANGSSAAPAWRSSRSESAFSQFTEPALLILSGVLLTAANMTMSYAYHAYQTEVFPTSIRARASGLVYSMSRLSAMFSGFIVAYMLRVAGVSGVFGLITAAMIIVIIAIAAFGPNVRGKPLDA